MSQALLLHLGIRRIGAASPWLSLLPYLVWLLCQVYISCLNVPGRGCLLLTLSVKAVLAEGPSSDTSQHLQVWGSLPSGALQCSSCYTQLWVLGGGGGVQRCSLPANFPFCLEVLIPQRNKLFLAPSRQKKWITLWGMAGEVKSKPGALQRAF